MAERIAVDFDVVRQHATRVEYVAAQISTARDAAASMNMGGGAFGLMCAFLVPPATAISSLATSTVAAAEAMVERSAREVRGMAGDFESLEERLVAEVRRLEASLEGGS
ncbi:type VII secretion target [Agromyces soli]